jgi:hypothetical protein
MISIDKSPEFVKLMARVHAEGRMPEMALRNFQQVIARFLSALRKALPDLSVEELVWKAHFALGAMAIALIARPHTNSEIAEESHLGIAARWVAFVSSGFKAPAILENEIEVNQ